MKPFLFLVLLAASLQAQNPVTFTQHIIAEQEFVAWKAAEQTRQGTTDYSWWLGGLTLCKLDPNGKPYILIQQHSLPGGMILKNEYPTFTDVTESLVVDKRLFPWADWKAHCRDFDNDGKLDIAGFRNDSATGRASFMSNWPAPMTRLAGLFSAVRPYGDHPAYLNRPGLDDLNGDGFRDVTDRLTDWLFNPPTRTFNQRVSLFAPPALPQAIQDIVNAHLDYGWHYFECCDVTGDGLKDVFVTGSKGYTDSVTGNFSRLLVQQPDGTLADETVARGLPVDAQVNMIENVLGDALPEIAMSRGTVIPAQGSTPKVYASAGLYLNNNGQFSKLANDPLTTAIGTYDPYPTDVDAVDFNGDGGKELIIHRSLGALLLFPHTGSGYATVSQNYTTGGLPSGCNASWRADGYDVADMDGDGDLDLVAGYGTSKGCASRIIIYENTSVVVPPPPPPPPPPAELVITSSTPLPGAAPGVAYSHTLTATGGVPPYEWVAVSGLPDGLILGTNGEITGAVGTQNVRVKVVDSAGTETETNLDLPLVGAIAQVRPLFLTPEVVARIKAKQQSSDPAWVEMKAAADRYLAYAVAPFAANGCPTASICFTYQGSGWLNAVNALGPVYAATGNTAYADKMLQILDAINAPFKVGNLQPMSIDRGYASRNSPLAVAKIWAWTYSRLSPQQKKDTVATVNAWYDWYRVPGNAGDATGPAYGNYFGGHLLGLGAAALVMEGDNPRAIEMQSYLRGLFDATVVPAFQTGGFAGGYPPESYGYGSRTFGYLLQYMEMYGIDATPYGKKIARGLIYNLKPNRWQTTDEGDYAGDYTGVLPGMLPLLLSEALAGTTEGGWMQWLYRHLGTPPAVTVREQKPDAYTRLLYEADRPEIDYRLTEPLAYCSPGDGHLFFRTDWTDSAVWGSFAGGSKILSGGHQSRAAGHISLQRGNDYLLVNAGQWKGPTGVSGTPQAFNLSSWRHNTLLFSDLGEYMYPGPAYVGGQGYWGTTNLRSCIVANGSASAETELASAYGKPFGTTDELKRSLLSFVRKFSWNGGSSFTVSDHIEAKKPTYVRKLLWHFNNAGKPTIAGNIIQSKVGASTLRIQVVSPIGAVIKAVPDGVSSITDPATLTSRVEISDLVPKTTLDSVQIITIY